MKTKTIYKSFEECLNATHLYVNSLVGPIFDERMEKWLALQIVYEEKLKDLDLKSKKAMNSIIPTLVATQLKCWFELLPYKDFEPASSRLSPSDLKVWADIQVELEYLFEEWCFYSNPYNIAYITNQIFEKWDKKELPLRSGNASDYDDDIRTLLCEGLSSLITERFDDLDMVLPYEVTLIVTQNTPVEIELLKERCLKLNIEVVGAMSEPTPVGTEYLFRGKKEMLKYMIRLSWGEEIDDFLMTPYDKLPYSVEQLKDDLSGDYDVLAEFQELEQADRYVKHNVEKVGHIIITHQIDEDETVLSKHWDYSDDEVVIENSEQPIQKEEIKEDGIMYYKIKRTIGQYHQTMEGEYGSIERAIEVIEEIKKETPYPTLYSTAEYFILRVNECIVYSTI